MFKRFIIGIYQDMLVKYGAHIFGYIVIALPVFGPRAAEFEKENTNKDDIVQNNIRNSSLLINLAKAIGRIVVSIKHL